MIKIRLRPKLTSNIWSAIAQYIEEQFGDDWQKKKDSDYPKLTITIEVTREEATGRVIYTLDESLYPPIVTVSIENILNEENEEALLKAIIKNATDTPVGYVEMSGSLNDIDLNNLREYARENNWRLVKIKDRYYLIYDTVLFVNYSSYITHILKEDPKNVIYLSPPLKSPPEYLDQIFIGGSQELIGLIGDIAEHFQRGNGDSDLKRQFIFLHELCQVLGRLPGAQADRGGPQIERLYNTFTMHDAKKVLKKSYAFTKKTSWKKIYLDFTILDAHGNRYSLVEVKRKWKGVELTRYDYYAIYDLGKDDDKRDYKQLPRVIKHSFEFDKNKKLRVLPRGYVYEIIYSLNQDRCWYCSEENPEYEYAIQRLNRIISRIKGKSGKQDVTGEKITNGLIIYTNSEWVVKKCGNEFGVFDWSLPNQLLEPQTIPLKSTTVLNRLGDILRTLQNADGNIYYHDEGDTGVKISPVGEQTSIEVRYSNKPGARRTALDIYTQIYNNIGDGVKRRMRDPNTLGEIE